MKKKPPASSLLDDVRATLQARKGPPPWYETLPAALKAEIDAIKADWKGGRLQATKTSLSVSISKALAARGVKIGHSGVIRWLEKA